MAKSLKIRVKCKRLAWSFLAIASKHYSDNCKRPDSQAEQFFYQISDNRNDIGPVMDGEVQVQYMEGEGNISPCLVVLCQHTSPAYVDALERVG